MPRIFDNIEQELLPALRQTLGLSERSDFCVGYFNLRGWKAIDGMVDKWSGEAGHQCRLLVGMQRLPQDELRQAYSLLPQEDQVSNQAVIRLKRRLAKEFQDQLTFGAPTDEDEAGLRRLAVQLKAGKVVVKLFLRHPLHAKLYLCFRPDPNSPIVGLYFQDKGYGKFVDALLNATLFFFWFVSIGNGRNITGTDVEQIPVPPRPRL